MAFFYVILFPFQFSLASTWTEECLLFFKYWWTADELAVLRCASLLRSSCVSVVCKFSVQPFIHLHHTKSVLPKVLSYMYGTFENAIIWMTEILQLVFIPVVSDTNDLSTPLVLLTLKVPCGVCMMHQHKQQYLTSWECEWVGVTLCGVMLFLTGLKHWSPARKTCSPHPPLDFVTQYSASLL